jgi:hypothetical protein
MAEASRAGQSRIGAQLVPDRTSEERRAVGPDGLSDQGQLSALVAEEQTGDISAPSSHLPRGAARVKAAGITTGS